MWILAFQTGRSVYAFSDGIVVGVGNQQGGFGQYIVIRHIIDGEIFYSVCGHLQQQNVQQDDAVLVGDQIALSNNTGASTGPHLHFEIRNAAGFNEETNQFPPNAEVPYWPDDFAELNINYTSPARPMPSINTAYGRHIENSNYRIWQFRIDRME